ncbi:MAG TPA: MaoC family dehydratase [Thermoanaerobaculaceae bacterium]|nr:MaoC family dehydratase [Thermoanaerobaculaceae bacterium]
MTIKPSWEGRSFEDFHPGDIFRHPAGRTITQTDNIWFTLLTVNSNPIHFDAPLAAQTEFGRPLVDSTLTLAIATGLSVTDLSRNGVNLGWDRVRLPRPVFEGDTLYAESEVLEARASRSRPTMGIVRVRTTGLNQSGEVVIEFERAIMVYRRGHAPSAPRPAARRSARGKKRDGRR